MSAGYLGNTVCLLFVSGVKHFVRTLFDQRLMQMTVIIIILSNVALPEWTKIPIPPVHCSTSFSHRRPSCLT